MQALEALKIRVVLVQHARENCKESAINSGEIPRAEIRAYTKICVLNVHSKDSRHSAGHQGNDGNIHVKSQLG